MSSSPTMPLNGSKLCHIVKRPDFDGYGFNLHSEKIKPGQFIGKVDANSPASAAGLKEGDRIVEVNGVSIGSETHKQVVQRIKAQSNEVRLLLIDVDGGSKTPTKTTTPPTTPITPTTPTLMSDSNNSSSNNNANENMSSNVQQMPGASANISSISMVSTKRMSNASSQGSQNSVATAVPVPTPTVPLGADVIDRGYMKNGGGSVVKNVEQPLAKEQENNNNINSNIPLPPSAAVASAPTVSVSTTPAKATTPPIGNGNNAGSLQLPMTAAEMRAKLAAKKKYDPKNESVDLKKKFDIIQKL